VSAALRVLPASGPDLELASYIDHPSGYLALSSKNQRFRIDGHPGFIAYREHGRHAFLFGGVHAPAASQAALLDGFLDAAAARRRRVVAVQIRRPQVALFAERGFVINELGQSYGLRLSGYSLAGTRRMKLRNKIKRARGIGVRILEVGRELPASAATFAALFEISDRWIKNKGKKELDFMIGELGGPEAQAGALGRRIFVAVLGEGAARRFLGFITYVPVFGERPGWLHDLTRRIPDSPPGTMELCNAEAMERLRRENAAHLHFGFTPFLTSGDEPPGHSRVLSRLIRMLARYGSFVYPAQSQVDYKLKWGPDLVEPEYVAARPLSLRAIIDLLLLTRSI
jgi:lysylphosphatidylglycerol synthetase-like protein (DUF2156 family)